ncbi:hypothetical protein [Spiroplasma citri]|uniref:Hypothetical transmembrane protein n=1 Tax=Spiroplasma citri TaxID=2133 RepID=Q14LK1_SPICI|nr:hypothetical protein [Spiroplasma citri]APE75518.1 hypothetical protein SCITRI_001649 [Spiroplasma citri]QED25372.1 hypothetical protein FRX96_08640 [Spiroplasma citri]QIA67722.1 hypothetical protein GMI18_09030 [Spiroplasma citri]QIA69571.1 hypothetical protein GL298_08950 [Spiroplasma citri]QIA71437.1 hypothetical protein GL981_08995 [Spiroplasma citri]
MGKFHTIASSLLVFGTINMTFMATSSFINQKKHIIEILSTTVSSPDEDDFIYSGYLLRYFIYKSSNINKNKTVKMMEKNIVNNKNKIYNVVTNIGNVKMDTKELFEMSLMASIINTSIYGMTTWKEFFAEAYSKWMTMPDEMKNKSWEILNNFFIDIYTPLQKENLGSRITSLQYQLDKIDQYVAKSNISYNTNLTKKPIDAVDLKYNLPSFEFGLQQLIPQDSNFWKFSYTFNALKTSLIMWQSSGMKDIKTINFSFNGNILRDTIINNGQDLTEGLGDMMNDSYTRASQSSRTKFENFMNTSKQKYYSSFDKLDEDLKKITEYENNYYYEKGSTIFLKDSVQAMQKYYHWNDKIIEFLKNQILNLFNMTYAITGDNFKYFLTGFLFSPDAPLLKIPGETTAYTSYFLELLPGTKRITSARSAYIIISAKEFADALLDKTISNYLIGWWSSPNIFCSLNHEMGHAVDVYYGMLKEARNVAPKYFQSYLNSLVIKDKYRGNIFGYDDIASYNQKVNIIKIVLIIMFGAFCTSIIISIAWGISRKIRTQKK